MNFKGILKILGKILVLEGILMIFPFIVSIIYKEYEISMWNSLAFLIPSISLIIIGLLLNIIKPNRSLYQKEGYVLCALVWLMMALFGAIPFVINGDIPNYVDALFEIMSGFTTTGASVIKDVSVLLHSTLFFRSFSHWIGGMGILVFVLIFIPESNDGSSMHLLKAESPGPQVGKLVSKMKATTRILYLIYLGFTLVEFLLLLLDSDIGVFNAILCTFGTAGTGGFSFVAGSIQYFSNYVQWIVAIFMMLFGINFTLYYLLLIGKVKDVFKSEELRCYLGIIIISTMIFVISTLTSKVFTTFPDALRNAFFTVSSTITSTGYGVCNYDTWPELCRVIIILLMISGAMAGSTGGGMKVSRLVIGVKGVIAKVKKIINPRSISKTKLDGKDLDDDVVNEVFVYITVYILAVIVCIVILSIDNWYTIDEYAGYDVFITNFTATISCISNIGPGLAAVGPYGDFSMYNAFSKIVLTFAMLIGRLEFYPVLLLFSPRTWKKA